MSIRTPCLQGDGAQADARMVVFISRRRRGAPTCWSRLCLGLLSLVQAAVWLYAAPAYRLMPGEYQIGVLRMAFAMWAAVALAALTVLNGLGCVGTSVPSFRAYTSFGLAVVVVRALDNYLEYRRDLQAGTLANRVGERLFAAVWPDSWE